MTDDAVVSQISLGFDFYRTSDEIKAYYALYKMDLNRVLRQLVERAESTWGRKVEFHPSHSEPWPTFDPYHLQYALWEALRNAHEATPPEGRISLSLNATPKEVTIVVRDSGTGLSEIALEHAFEPFFTTKADHQGLGLSTTFGVVASSGGSISIRNDNGCVVTVILPEGSSSSRKG
jgi:signal transduction histidine kinase